MQLPDSYAEVLSTANSDVHAARTLECLRLTSAAVTSSRGCAYAPYNKHSMNGADPRWLLLMMLTATKAYVMRPNASADINVPATAKTVMVPKLRKKSRFFKVNPAAKTIGGKSP